MHSPYGFISPPKSCPSLLCCHFYFIYICMYAHRYSNTLGCTVQYLPSLWRVFSQFFSHRHCLSRPLFLIQISFSWLLTECSLFRCYQYCKYRTWCISVFQCSRYHQYICYALSFLHLLICCIVLSFCLLNSCSPYYQFQSARLRGLFQNYFNTYCFWEPYGYSAFISVWKSWLCSQYAELIVFPSSSLSVLVS